MARLSHATRRRTRQNRTKQAVDLINDLSMNPEDDEQNDTRVEDNGQNEGLEPGVEEAEGDDQFSGLRSGKAIHVATTEELPTSSRPSEDHNQNRRSTRLNPRISYEATPVPEQNISQLPSSPLFVPQSPEEDDAEDESDVDALSSTSEVYESEPAHIPEAPSPPAVHEEQTKIPSPPVVVINEKDTTTAEDFPISRSVKRTYTRHRISGNDGNNSEPNESESDEFQPDDDEIAETEQSNESGGGSEAAESQAGDLRLFDSDEEEQSISHQHSNGISHQELAEQDTVVDNAGEISSNTQPRTRLIDRLDGQSSQTVETSSRKRRRTVDPSESTPDGSRSRRRRTSPRQNTDLVATGARLLPTEMPALEIAEWEASTLDEGVREEEEVVIIAERTAYDEATKIRNLDGNWKRLIKICREIKAVEIHRTLRFLRIEEIRERISELVDNYKRIQRKRSRGSVVSSETWQRTKQEVKYISGEAEEIRFKIIARANEARKKRDMSIKAEVTEYAEQIYQEVVTNLSELALECLKTYYSEEDEWLLAGGFKEVLDILDVAGKIIVTLTSLQKCDLLKIVRDPGRHLRVEMRAIYDALIQCEDYEKRRSRSGNGSNHEA